MRTLSNAIATGRIAHAFILTGVRGVGKTTTARDSGARAQLCRARTDRAGRPLPPAGCVPELPSDRRGSLQRRGRDGCRLAHRRRRYPRADRGVAATASPILGRYRVYIIDEVHMLSRNAFNALLKTLEEPPPHAKFVFATTEIQKVPLTVLSRCQRFSLRRVPVELLVRTLPPDCRGGSGRGRARRAGTDRPRRRRVGARRAVAARPGDRPLALPSEAPGSAKRSFARIDRRSDHRKAVRDMLGVADRGCVLDLLESVLRGDAGDALDRMDRLYQDGADPLMVLAGSARPQPFPDPAEARARRPVSAIRSPKATASAPARSPKS